MPSFARLAPLLFLALVAAVLYATGLGDWLSLENMKQHEAVLQQFVGAHFWPALVVFVGLFVAVTASFIPVATILTLAGGFLFGPWLGAVGTIAGATLGAAITFGAVRTAFGASLARRCADGRGRLQSLMRGIGRNAFYYVLALRLAPLVPFSLVNVAAGLSGAPWRPYVLATVVGAVPTSLLYSYLGSGLGAALGEGHGVASTLLLRPQIMWALAGLAVVSLAPILFRNRIARMAGDEAD